MGNEPIQESPFDAMAAETITLTSKEEDASERWLAEIIAKDEIIAEKNAEIIDYREQLLVYKTAEQEAKDKRAVVLVEEFLSLIGDTQLSDSVRETVERTFMARVVKQLEKMTLGELMALSQGIENA